jgi:large subunit ribosomal protein L5
MAAYVPVLKKTYVEKIRQELKSEFGYKSTMQIPRLEKVIVSMGIGDAVSNKKVLEAAVNELSLITGQRPIKTRARKSIANFKLRDRKSVV